MADLQRLENDPGGRARRPWAPPTMRLVASVDRAANTDCTGNNDDGSSCCSSMSA